MKHPLSLGTFSNWLAVVRMYGGIEGRFVPKAVGVTLSSLAAWPLGRLENKRYAYAVDRIQIDHPPVFIIGHWRTGTTWLHQLMIEDGRFGYVTYMQAMAPESFIHRLEQYRVLARSSPGAWSVKRPMDNILLNPLSPEEEEFAIASVCPYSFLHGWYFPRHMRSLFQKFALFQNVESHVVEAWKEAYLRILKKAAFASQGKQLVLKNPFNSARIKLLLELFPNAKFIHIYRNPYVVFASTKHLYARTLNIYRFQSITAAEVEKNILAFYRAMMEKLLAEIKDIPSRNFTEIKYEELEERPVERLR